METHIISGPVIIEAGKVLLNREQKTDGTTRWLFPGGHVEVGENLEQACTREVKEEMGIDIKIIKKLSTTETEHLDIHYILHHYLAQRTGEIIPGSDIVEWAWHDINNLPDNCAPNVYQIIKELTL